MWKRYCQLGPRSFLSLCCESVLHQRLSRTLGLVYTTLINADWPIGGERRSSGRGVGEEEVDRNRTNHLESELNKNNLHWARIEPLFVFQNTHNYQFLFLRNLTFFSKIDIFTENLENFKWQKQSLNIIFLNSCNKETKNKRLKFFWDFFIFNSIRTEENALRIEVSGRTTCSCRSCSAPRKQPWHEPCTCVCRRRPEFQLSAFLAFDD